MRGGFGWVYALVGLTILSSTPLSGGEVEWWVDSTPLGPSNSVINDIVDKEIRRGD